MKQTIYIILILIPTFPYANQTNPKLRIGDRAQTYYPEKKGRNKI
jgi:hypothetical protein